MLSRFVARDVSPSREHVLSLMLPRLGCCLLLAAVSLPSCRSEGDPHAASHEQEAEHQHEVRHDGLPREVELSPQVIKDAGVRWEPVARRAIEPTVLLVGEVAADPNRQASVAARIEGVIDSITVVPGDVVHAGDVIATVRAPGLQDLRSAATSLRAQARAARANYNRLKALAAQGIATRQELVNATAQADALDAEARGAAARLKNLGITGAESAGRSYELAAPISGVVLHREVSDGAPVLPDSVVVTILSTESVWFIAHVFERDLARVQVGSPASVTLNAYQEADWDGKVSYLSNEVETDASTIAARIPLDNPDGRLRIGLFGTAQVVATGEVRPAALTIRKSAITQLEGQSVAFVRHEDGHFEVHDLVLGQSDVSYVEVLHGLLEGEDVVYDGVFTLKSVLLKSTMDEEEH